jgi:predicted metal-dependent peptidase
MNPIHKATLLRIDRARWWALSSPAAVFYGALATHLVDVIDESVKTAETDGKRIIWNPTFVAGLTDEELRFVLIHEVLHCAHGHLWRLPPTPQANRAGDYAINRVLQGIAGIAMPAGCLLDPRFDDLSEEEILAALGREAQPQPGNGKPSPGAGGGKPQPQPGKGQPDDEQTDSSDPGGCGGFTAPDKTPNPQGKTLAEKWEQAVIQAEFTAKTLGKGNAPADLKRILDRIRATEVDWKREVADFARNTISASADWSRSTRRMATAPVIYPRRKRDRVGCLLVVRDTSGSIDNKLCAEFSAQVTQVIADLQCRAIVLDVDTRLHAEYRLEPGDECPSNARGGGGTAFTPAFDRLAELQDEGEDIAGVLYLTDLDGEFPDNPPDVPTLWVAYGTTRAAPFGRTLHVK